MSQYRSKVEYILSYAEKCHRAYYGAQVFGGPSLYFHRRCLEARDSVDFNLYLEYIYATLASWGMHRMGGGPKMQSFEVFAGSIETIKESVLQGREIDYRNVTEADWRLLEKIFRGIDVMATASSLVGNSKVMAHMMPNIIPPIDREYTLEYLTGNKNIKNGLDNEWALMKNIISEFFVPVGCDPQFIVLANNWVSMQSQYPWDTSVFKVIDNLVIGASKLEVETNAAVSIKPGGGK
jgi:hypothetical protein